MTYPSDGYSQLDQLERYEPADTPPPAAPVLPPPASPLPLEDAGPDVDEPDVDEDQAGPLPAAVVQVTGVGFLARWLSSNPVRVWLYGVITAAILVLVGYGLLTDQQGFLWGALGAAVLGVPTTEAVRGSVYSPRGAAAAAWQAVQADRAAR